MEYKTVAETAERMGVTVRSVQKWAKEGKIEGAIKTGRDWFIPLDAVRPGTAIDTENNKYIMLNLTGCSYPVGRCKEYIDSIDNVDKNNMAMGEYLYYCGELEKASGILEPYLNSSVLGYKCHSSVICAFSNLLGKHTTMTDFAMSIIKDLMYNKLPYETDIDEKALGVFMGAIVTIQFHFDLEQIPPLEDYVRYLPEGLKLYACYLMAYKAYFEKDYSRSLGIANTAIGCCRQVYPIPMAYLHIIAAVDLMNLMQKDKAKEHIKMAWELIEKDGFIMPFVEHYGMLHGMIEVFFKKDYPEVFARIIKVTDKFNSGWYEYHNKTTGGTVADNLTTTEFTVAMLFNRGWRVKEIADHIERSERTVKNYLQIIYEKLGINNKRELERFMLK